MPQGIEPGALEVERPALIGSFYELPKPMDWFDNFVPLSFALGSEEWHPIKLEEFIEDDEITIRAELPGVDPEKDIEVIIGDGILTITGQRREEREGADRSDFYYGSFMRSIALPNGTDDRNVRATYKDGILEVKVECLTSSSAMKRVTVNRI